MTHKYKIGDEVFYIKWSLCYKEYILKHVFIMGTCPYSKEHYMIKERGYVFVANLYTKLEALEFMTNYINKTEE
tara:strand:- start:594 stop:815 length:222 start_codon:yes stop_codon:yes gene_type:complete